MWFCVGVCVLPRYHRHPIISIPPFTQIKEKGIERVGPKPPTTALYGSSALAHAVLAGSNHRVVGVGGLERLSAREVLQQLLSFLPDSC